MISIYTYLLIVTALTLLSGHAAFSKSHHFSGVMNDSLVLFSGLSAAGTSTSLSPMRNSLRLRHAATLPIFAAGNLFPADAICNLPIASTQRKELPLTHSRLDNPAIGREILLNHHLTHIDFKTSQISIH
ncbi:MAG: hypothetical protein IH598_16490 [Bacteroidales bacterium]|nr:hypothetical protein [Bacteroidales bacterium]